MIKKRKGFVYDLSEQGHKWKKENKCPMCGKPKSEWNRRKDWTCCSIECTKKHKKLFKYWAETRLDAIRRDGYKCVKCGYEAKRIIKNVEKIYSKDGVKTHLRTGYFIRVFEDENSVKCAEVGCDSEFVGDHIVPIALGGKEFDIDNVQTLCKKCNKEKTAQDMKDIAEYRKLLKENKL